MAKSVKLQEVAIDKLRPYERNAKLHPEDQVEKLVASINEFGFVSPCLIDEDYNIIAGHGRVEAAKRAGLEKVPCVFVEGLTDAQRRAYILADNRLTELGGWDMGTVANELIALRDEDFEIELTGFEVPDRAADWFENHEKGEATDKDTEEYKEFLEKFEQKHTTDDCYTPEPVYEAVANYVAKRYGVNRDSFVRPFYPGGDYQHEKYPEDCVVVDNPPFSIFKEIIRFYNQNAIKYFLFCPSLAAMNYADECTTINLQAAVTYENGANVPTSFCTNLGNQNVAAESNPELYKKVKEASDEYRKSITREIPKYKYPNEVVTAAMLGYLSRYGEKLELKRDECQIIRALDAQREAGKGLYGNGLLLSEKAAAEKAAAEKAAAEKAAAIEWPLSDREREIIKSLGGEK